MKASKGNWKQLNRLNHIDSQLISGLFSEMDNRAVKNLNKPSQKQAVRVATQNAPAPPAVRTLRPTSSP